MTTETKTREISDLPLVSYLSMQGLEFIRVSKNERNGRRTFVFVEDEQLESLIMGFYNRHAQVEPMGFAETLRNLKALIHQGDK